MSNLRTWAPPCGCRQKRNTLFLTTDEASSGRGAPLESFRKTLPGHPRSFKEPGPPAVSLPVMFAVCIPVNFELDYPETLLGIGENRNNNRDAAEEGGAGLPPPNTRGPFSTSQRFTGEPEVQEAPIAPPAEASNLSRDLGQTSIVDMNCCGCKEARCSSRTVISTCARCLFARVAAV